MLLRFHSQIIMMFILLFSSQPLWADSVEQINDGSRNALIRLFEHADGADHLLADAAGVLVFPDMFKMGFGIGGQYGEGVLLVDDKPDSYYASAGKHYGLEPGDQYKSEIIVFRTEEALQQFRSIHGWKVGQHGEVELLELDAGGRVDFGDGDEAVVGFIFSKRGMQPELNLQGTKITRLAR